MTGVRLRGVWGRLAEEIQARPASNGHRSGVWGRLVTLVDVQEFRPRLAEDIEIREFTHRWGTDYSMIANPRDLVYYRLTPEELEVARLMDGTRTVKEIVVDRLKGSGGLELSSVADLVYELSFGNFLDRPFVDVDAAVQRALHPAPGARQRVGRFFKTLRLDWKGADRLVRWFYRYLLRWFFLKPVLLIVGVVSVGGFLAFLSIVRSGDFSLTAESAASGFLILMGLNYLLTFIHELGHAVVLTHHGRRVKSAGFMIYFGSPAFFVESSDGLMLDRGQRIAGAFAGPYAESVVSGAAALLVWLFPEAPFSPLLYKFAVLNYLVLFMNLIPLLELDGYWILSDFIQVPDLRPRSLSFIRHDFWHKLRNRVHLSRQEVGLALYGFLGVAFTIFSLATAGFFWKNVFGGLLLSLWNGGTIPRLVLVLLVLVVLGPIVRGLINLARAVSRRLGALSRRVRFRLERKWRVEAAGLIDALPLFDDVPEEVLSDLAGRVGLRTFGRGQPVVRQGERARAFYVVRRGTLQVVEEDVATGNERALRVLGPGESFGELGLAEAVPRSATVRALEESELFEIDKGTFDRLLSDMAEVPEFAPTLQSVAELRELPCLSHLEADELARVLEHGAWQRFPPGATIVDQGEVGDAFYVIRAGQVEVVENGRPVATLGPGAYFGEVALLLDVPRTAAVVARTPLRVYRLDRQGFDELVRDAFTRGTLNPHISPDRTWQH